MVGSCPTLVLADSFLATAGTGGEAGRDAVKLSCCTAATVSSLLEGVMGGRRRGVGGREVGDGGWLLLRPLLALPALL